MANDTYGRVWKIDTAGSTVLHPGPFRAQSVRWVSPAAEAGHALTIQDSNGKELWRSLASGANHLDGERLDTWWNQGFKVPTLDSGTLYITVN